MCRRVFSLLAFLPVLQIDYHLLTGLYTTKNSFSIYTLFKYDFRIGK